MAFSRSILQRMSRVAASSFIVLTLAIRGKNDVVAVDSKRSVGWIHWNSEVCLVCQKISRHSSHSTPTPGGAWQMRDPIRPVSKTATEPTAASSRAAPQALGLHPRISQHDLAAYELW